MLMAQPTRLQLLDRLELAGEPHERALRIAPLRSCSRNDGFILLGAVVQKLSGESYGGYLRRRILDPAAMTHTVYATYIPAHVTGMAHGYALIGAKRSDISHQPQIANPSGGACSTTGDLLRFSHALLDHKLLDPAMTETILTPRVSAPQPGGGAVESDVHLRSEARDRHVIRVGSHLLRADSTAGHVLACHPIGRSARLSTPGRRSATCADVGALTVQRRRVLPQSHRNTRERSTRPFAGAFGA